MTKEISEKSRVRIPFLSSFATCSSFSIVESRCHDKTRRVVLFDSCVSLVLFSSGANQDSFRTVTTRMLNMAHENVISIIECYEDKESQRSALRRSPKKKRAKRAKRTELGRKELQLLVLPRRLTSRQMGVFMTEFSTGVGPSLNHFH